MNLSPQLLFRSILIVHLGVLDCSMNLVVGDNQTLASNYLTVNDTSDLAHGQWDVNEDVKDERHQEIYDENNPTDDYEDLGDHYRIPYQVSIWVNDNHSCTGAIIDHNLVLLSANCLDHVVNVESDLQVVIGRYNSGPLKALVKSLKVVSHLVHPGHVVQINTTSYSKLEHDLAILHTEGMQFRAPFIDKVKLPSISTDVNLTGRAVHVTGWGTIHDTHFDQLEDQFELTIVSFGACKEVYPPEITRQIHNDNIICAGPQSLPTCQGVDCRVSVCAEYAGAPLILRDSHFSSRDQLIGIETYARKCDSDGKNKRPLGIYTDIRRHKNWIMCAQLLARGTHTSDQVNKIFEAKGQCSYCTPGYICPSNFNCINPSQMCNGEDDCGGSSDDETPNICLLRRQHGRFGDYQDTKLGERETPCSNMENCNHYWTIILIVSQLLLLILIFIAALLLSRRWAHLRSAKQSCTDWVRGVKQRHDRRYKQFGPSTANPRGFFVQETEREPKVVIVDLRHPTQVE